MDRVERLTNLLALLLETRVPLTLVEIAGALEGMYPESPTARRGAFERDKAALRAIGVPIETEMDLAGEEAGTSRYRIDRARYELQDLDLTHEERRALQVAVAATRGGTGSAREGLLKLGAPMSSDQEPTDHPAVVAVLATSPTLGLLREAVAGRAVVRFAYRDRDREVEPYGLLLQDGFWYLVGQDRGPSALRTFRVDRIRSEVSLSEPGAFERPDLDLRDILPRDPREMAIDRPGETALGESEAATAIVRVYGARAVIVEREVSPAQVRARSESGAAVDATRWVEVEVPCRNRAAFRSWVLGLGADAEVRAPSEVRTEIIEWLRAMALSPEAS